MCVTFSPAKMGGTRAFTYATLSLHDHRASHISGYQNAATNLSRGPNCMLLHYPGNDLQLVKGPEHTKRFMLDMTRQLTRLSNLNPLVTRSAQPRAAEAVIYGDYDVVIAEQAADIEDAIETVQPDRRPHKSDKLMSVIDWYEHRFQDHCFVLACFDGSVDPTHPIVVEYVPHSDDVLFVPGLDGHDGDLPREGQDMQRDFRVAFGSDYTTLPIPVNYGDDVTDMRWAPTHVSGFYDDRRYGPNVDYVVPLEAINEGLNGPELVDVMVS